MKTGLLKTRRSPFLLTVLFIFILFSCDYIPLQKKEKPPLDKQTIEDILTEMYLLEGKIRIYMYHETPDSLKIWVNNEMSQLFKRYNTTYKQFTNSYLSYMGDDSEVAKKIMSNITNRLILLETEQKKNTKQLDTLNNHQNEENTNG
jgi:hypothetical protein